jgi:hypothetical protein
MTITIPDELAASLTAEAERQGMTAEELALQGVRQVVFADAERGYELDDEMKAIVAANKNRWEAEAASPPPEVARFADDLWEPR